MKAQSRIQSKSNRNHAKILRKASQTQAEPEQSQAKPEPEASLVCQFWAHGDLRPCGALEGGPTEAP